MFQQKWGSVARKSVLLAVMGVMASAGFAAQSTPATGGDSAVTASSKNPALSKDPFVDPLDAPAVMHESVVGRPLMSIASAGKRLVAVGMRGLIVISDDSGKSWLQVRVPVSSDLLALSFPDASDGWVVGHDGVVLHTADGGQTWIKQFDGREAAKALVADYQTRIDAGDKSLQPYLDQLVLNYKSGPSLPLLSVWFKDAQHGMAVGPFGMAVITDDGGKAWHPMLDRIANPQFLHLNAINEIAGDVYIAGEQGTVFKLDPHSGKFQLTQTDYAGSFFGMTGNQDEVIAYGLRGTIYRSADHGVTWAKVQSPLHGTVTSAVYVPSRKAFVFVTAAGEVAMADSAVHEFHLLEPALPTAFTGVQVTAGGALAISSLAGPNARALQ
jgi:photosystem II stability/assembly factor-like uncharacterized protein